MNWPLRIVGAVLVVTFRFSVVSAEPNRYASDSPYGIPLELQRSLEQRLSAFIDAQANERWGEVASFFGRYRMGGNKLAYSTQHKECFLSQVSSAPMVSFAFEGIRYSSELTMTPADLRWWYLDGPAEFRTTSGLVHRSATVVAYRDAGDWYFTPPNIDSEWEMTHITDAERAADYGSDLDVDLGPKCPVEIRDLRVSMDKRFPSLRNAVFTLVNKSSKTIKAYGLGLGQSGDECFGVTSGRPTVIVPEGVSSHEKPLGYAAYGYWCEGVRHHRLVVDSVLFADGSEWHDSRFINDEHRRQCGQ